jgi:hypothetical protein
VILNFEFTFFRKPAAGLALAAGLILAAPAAAATQGEPAARSTGSVSISATVAGRTLVSGVQDLALAETGSTGDLAGSETLCIWTNTATRQYAVTAAGSGPQGAFALADAAGGQLAYSAQWGIGSGTMAGTGDIAQLVPGIPLIAQLPQTAGTLCPAGGNASLNLAVPSQDLAGSAASGTYAGNLTLTIAPQ